MPNIIQYSFLVCYNMFNISIIYRMLIYKKYFGQI